MKSHLKYGILAACGWNILLFLAMLVRARVKDVSLSYFFDDETGGIAMAGFLVLWSVIWFGIGSHARKDFLVRKKLYEADFPHVDKNVFDKTFRRCYFSRQARMLGVVFATAVPWYVIGYVKDSLCYTDFMIIGPLMLLSIFCFWYYKKYRVD